jgi:outer membrane lipoprotein-sorting protein
MLSLVAAAVAAHALLLPRALPAATARDILDKAKALDDTTRHWSDRSQTMTLVIHDARGGERKRTLQVFSKRYPGDEDKALSFFLTPPEVKGTGFLQWAHKRNDDDQWLYLPEFKRTRRITAQLRDESFMGTDFSYRDLEILGEIQRWTEEEAPSTLVGEEKAGEKPCHVIALRPQQEGMTYGRIVLWIEQDKLVARKMEFYDREDTLRKALALDDVRDVGPIPTAHRLDMRDVKKGSRTEVDLSDVKYNTGLADDLFTQRQLERGAP